jgi:uncharacterized protein (TIGR02246 family)
MIEPGFEKATSRIILSAIQRKAGAITMKSILVLLVALMLGGCVASEEKKETPNVPDAKADLDALNKLRDDFIAAFNAGDSAKIGELYAEDAVAMPGDGSPTLKGRAAIVERNKALFDQATAKITITPSRNVVSGDLGYDEGTYTMEMTPKAKGSKAVREEGRYVVVLQRRPEGWKVIEDIDNAIKPLAAAGTK